MPAVHFPKFPATYETVRPEGFFNVTRRVFIDPDRRIVTVHEVRYSKGGTYIGDTSMEITFDLWREIGTVLDGEAEFAARRYDDQ